MLSRIRKITGLAWILLISVLLRFGAAFYLGDKVVDLPGTYDQISYHTLAVRVLTGHGFSFATVWWPITGDFGDAISRTWVEQRELILRGFVRFTKHLT